LTWDSFFRSTLYGKIVKIGRIIMAIAINTRTGKTVTVPDHYIGHSVLGNDLELLGSEVKAAPTDKKKKKLAEYVPNAIDGDGDDLVQDGTVWERPVGTEIQEQSAPDNTKENEE
jgi:hypothetical protein